ncbi:MAG: hypothetical protein JSS35_03185, partial [Proteobacteria bacterium]|nr:hypothetical protein [Pseudomonadota bacterium]
MGQFKTAMLVGAMLTASLAASEALAAQTNFTDTTFNTADYTLGSFKDPSVTVNSFTQTANGNPGSALEGMSSSTGLNATGVLLTALNNTFVYDPTASGAITSLDVSLDRWADFTDAGQESAVGSYSLRLLAEQDGTLYQATFVFGPVGIDGGFWVNLSQAGITANQFTVLDSSNFATGGGATGLDYGGDAITFGFAMRASGAVQNGSNLPSTDDQAADMRADN